MTQAAHTVLIRAAADERLSDQEALALLDIGTTEALTEAAEALCVAGHGRTVSFSK